MKNKRYYLTTLVVVAAGVVLAACGNAAPAATLGPTAVPPGAVVAEGHIRPVQGVVLAFQGRGTVSDILVKQGDQVKQGQVLMRLAEAGQAQEELVSAQQALDLLQRNAPGDRAKYWRAYMDAQKAREEAQKKWDDLNVPDIETRITDRQNDVEDRKVDLDQAQREFDQKSTLNKDDPKYKEARDKLDHAQSDYDIAVKDLESTMRERDVPRATLDAALATEAEAKYQYDLSQNGPNTDQLALAKARVAAAQDALDNYELRAPFDGVVGYVSVDVGQQVGPETTAVSVADFSNWIVETDDVTELEVVKLAVGQSATMVPDALPDVVLNGTIQEISQSFTKQGGDILYTVRLKVANVDPRVRWGMTVEATFPPLGK